MRVNGCIYRIVMAAAMLGGSALSAQEITIDWADKSIKSSPTEIHKGDTVKVTVTNVNNILYDYKVNVSLQTGSSDDLALLGKLLGGGGSIPMAKVEVTDCQSAIKNATKQLNDINVLVKKEPNLNASTNSAPIPLAASLVSWEVATKANLPDLDTDVAKVKSLCTGDESQQFLAGAYDKFDKFRKKVEGPHTAEGQSVASSGEVSAVIVNVTESYKDADGKTQTVYIFNKTINFSAVLNLSGGVLLSTLRHPTYIRQAVPGATDPILAINGGAQPVPYIVGLLNYRFPGLDWAKVGFALSTGPVLRVGGDTNTSSFGYFNGMSLHLWH